MKTIMSCLLIQLMSAAGTAETLDEYRNDRLAAIDEVLAPIRGKPKLICEIKKLANNLERLTRPTVGRGPLPAD